APYTFIEQREPEYWKRMTAQYEEGVRQLLDEAKRQAKEAKDKAPWEARVKAIESFLAQKNDPAKLGKVKDLYSLSAYKLLTHKDLCLQCHPIGPVNFPGAKGPNLALAAERLRPEWIEEWVAHPTRLFPYLPTMPQNFPNNPDPLKWERQDL